MKTLHKIHSKDLFVSLESCNQLGKINVLHIDALINSETGRSGSTLAEDHVRRLHTDGRVRDVSGAHGDGVEKVDRIVLLGDDTLVGNIEGSWGSDVHLAFVTELSINKNSLDLVDVEGVGALANAVVWSCGRRLDIALSHGVATVHATSFSDVDLIRPVAIAEPLILGISPFIDSRAQGRRNALVVGQCVEETLSVRLVIEVDLSASLV